MMGFLHAGHLPLKGLVPHLLELVGGEVVEGHGDEVVIPQAGGEV